MQVIFHAGAHCTDEDRLLKCLLRNKAQLARHGTAVPGPGKYRTLLKEAYKAMLNAPPAEDAREVLIDAILDEETADRLVLSNENFFGSQRYALDGNTLYPLAEERLDQTRQLFHLDRIELFLAIRNPASFLPLVLRKASAKRLHEVLSTTDPAALRWSDLLTRIRAALPEIPITVWCNEDTPLIWGQLLREMGGLDHGAPVEGELDLLAEIMSPDGMQRLKAYLAARPELTEIHRRRVYAAFLDKFAIDEAVEEELDLPGWTEELVDDLTERYDEDLLRIQRIPDVTLITP